jgi:hypothetical protein
VVVQLVVVAVSTLVRVVVKNVLKGLGFVRIRCISNGNSSILELDKADGRRRREVRKVVDERPSSFTVGGCRQIIVHGARDAG